jgi:hypothetical protein
MAEVAAEPLDAGRPEWGTVYVVPWDTDIFGFPVAVWQPGDPGVVSAKLGFLGQRLKEWALLHQVELVACTVAADHRGWRSILPALDFTAVEQTVRIILRLQPFDTSPPATPVRLAVAGDIPRVEEIADHAFRHGRYHADPRFPPELADRRYRRWVGNALVSKDPLDRVYVLGRPGTVKGFFQLRLVEDRAEVGIIAVAKTLQGSSAGPQLVAGTQLALKADGVRWITSKVAAANTGLLNLVTHFGYRLRQPETTFHWHSPCAPHLLPPCTVPREE